MGGTFGQRHRLADLRAGRQADRQPDHRRRTLFPALVTLGSSSLALLLFFQTTVPALKEQKALAQVEQHQLALQGQLIREATGFALRRTGLSRDIQTVLLELDRQGIYPAKLLAELRARAATSSGPQ
jgi:hypothetical protein